MLSAKGDTAQHERCNFGQERLANCRRRSGLAWSGHPRGTMDNGVALATLSALTTDHYGLPLKPPSRRKRDWERARAQERERERENPRYFATRCSSCTNKQLLYSYFLFFSNDDRRWRSLSFPGDDDREKLIIADGFLLPARCVMTLTEYSVDRRVK